MGKFTDKFMLRTIEVKGVNPETLLYPPFNEYPVDLSLFNIVMHLATSMELNDIQSYEWDKPVDGKISCTAYKQKDGEHCDVIMTWGEIWYYEDGELYDTNVVSAPEYVTFR